MGQEQSNTYEGNQTSGGFDSDIANRNNRANQRNPNNEVYYTSRQYEGRPDDWRERAVRSPRENDNNRSKQLNPNNPLYFKSRGQDGEISGQVETQEDTSSTMENVMWWMQTAGLAISAFEVGRQVYNNLAAEAEREQEEQRQQRRSD